MASPVILAPREWPARFPVYYGWVMVVLGTLAMTATLPGRTHGLGLITKPLLDDLQISERVYAQINLWSSLIGAAFCLPIGAWIDRFGVRRAVVLGLALAVLAMGRVTGALSLFAALIVIRGLGQSALSVVSMSMISKWFGRRIGLAMGVFSILMTFGFIGSILGMGEAVKSAGWRPAWNGVGYALLAFLPVGWLLIRSTPEACGITPDGAADNALTDVDRRASFKLKQTLRTPAFWVFVLGTSAFNLVWSGVMLFNELILAEKGFDQQTSVEIMAILTGVGLLSNIASGLLATRRRIGLLLGIGLAVFSAGLAAFPTIDTLTGVRCYAAAMGVTGGVVMVVFFAAWRQLFGRAHCGHIQGMAQAISVLASSLGPVLIAEGHSFAGSYLPVFYPLAAATGILAIAAFFVPLPRAVATDGTSSAANSGIVSIVAETD